MFEKRLLIVLIGFSPFLATGQSVGLVLSGGGSKGLAHIGVIKALEENGIPIDYVGGTSMGAIVGACYAMGLTAEEMITIFQSQDFSYWMSGEMKEEDMYYFKAEYPEADILRIGLDFRDTVPKPRLPLSYIQSYLMDFAFMEIFSRASAAAGYDFDSLFVPFLCNSVDISNSREVVFRKGDLTQAVRASMTVPIYFRPILIDGNIMYDGGIYNNFPVNHVIEQFHPDVIIGSKAAKGNIAPDEYDLMGHIEKIVIKPSSYNIDPDHGVLLDMDFGTQSLLAFDKLEEFVEDGYRTTMMKMDSIKLLIHRQAEDPESLQAKREAFKESWPPLNFKGVDSDGLDKDQEYYVERSIRKSNTIIEVAGMKREYLKLAHDKSLLYLYPKAIYDERDSLFTLGLRVIPQSALEASFGLFFSTTGLAQTYLGFSYRDISQVSSHLKGSVQFGRRYNGANLGFRFDYPSRIPLFFEGSFNYNGIDYNLYNTNFFFEDLEPPYITENELNFRIDLGIPCSVNGVLKGGLGIGRNNEIYYMNHDFSSSDTSEVSNVNNLSLYAAMESNTLNNKQFFTEGSHQLHSVRVGYGVESYFPGSTSENVNNEKVNYFWFIAKYENTGYIPINGAFSLGYLVNLTATFRPLLSNYYSTMIEAPVFRPNMITKALFMEHYRANQFIALGLIPVYKFSKQFHAKAEAYTFFPVQEILRDASNDAYLGTFFNVAKTLFDASLNLVTVAGPVSFHMGYITEEENPWVLQLSFGYLLFNKRSVD